MRTKKCSSPLQVPTTSAVGSGAGSPSGEVNPKRATKRKPTARSLHRHASAAEVIASVSSAISATHAFLRHHDLILLPSQTLGLESLLSASSLSLSNLLSLLPHIPTSLSPPPSQQHGLSSYASPSATAAACWFHRFLLVAVDDFDPRWPQFFRMSKPTFSLLLSSLSPHLLSSLPSIPPNYALGAALYRLAHAAPYAAVARRFGISSQDACRGFYAVCKVVCDRLGYLFEFRSDLERVVVGFGWMSLPNCCGVLGVGQFPVEGQVLGQNGFLMVQALVDSLGRFLDVSAGWPCSMSPEMVLRKTKLFAGVEESELLNGRPFVLADGNTVPQYVLGASCFPPLPWLLTPYAEGSGGEILSSMELGFNDVHSGAMGLVSMAFRRVRVLWELLNRRWKGECVEFLPFVIVTGCLLHNFLIKNDEALPDASAPSVEELEIAPYRGQGNESAQRIRDVLALHLSRVR